MFGGNEEAAGVLGRTPRDHGKYKEAVRHLDAMQFQERCWIPDVLSTKHRGKAGVIVPLLRQQWIPSYCTIKSLDTVCSALLTEVPRTQLSPMHFLPQCSCSQNHDGLCGSKIQRRHRTAPCAVGLPDARKNRGDKSCTPAGCEHAIVRSSLPFWGWWRCSP